MEKQFISLEDIQELKKKRFSLWFFIGAIFLFLLAFAFLAFSLQTRASQRLWIVLGTVLTSLGLLVVAYVLIKMMMPLQKYLAFSQQALAHSRIISKVKITGICKDIESYDGFKTRSVEGEEVDEKTKFHFRYDGTSEASFRVSSVYEIETYDDVIVRAKEVL